METKPNNDQTEPQQPTAPEPEEPEPQEPTTPPGGEPGTQPKTWQEYATKFLYLLRDWFLKAKTAYKIAAIILVVAILVVLLLAYLGIFGQQIADLMKQLVNKIMEMVGARKS